MFAKSFFLRVVTRAGAPGLGRGHLGMGGMICLLTTMSSANHVKANVWTLPTTGCGSQGSLGWCE